MNPVLNKLSRLSVTYSTVTEISFVVFGTINRATINSMKTMLKSPRNHHRVKGSRRWQLNTSTCMGFTPTTHKSVDHVCCMVYVCVQLVFLCDALRELKAHKIMLPCRQSQLWTYARRTGRRVNRASFVRVFKRHQNRMRKPHYPVPHLVELYMSRSPKLPY